MKEKVLEAFSDLGFKLEYSEGMGYDFKYEGINFLYMYNENDEDFLSISVPGICDFEEDKAIQSCALLEKINSTLKYVKAYILGGSIWLFYERELLGGEDLMMLVSRMILHLEAGLRFARKAMKEIEETVEGNSVEEEDNAVEEIVDEENNNKEDE